MSSKISGESGNRDAGLKGNEKLEEQIKMLQTEPSGEMLAVVLTTLRRRMREGGQLVVAVDPTTQSGLSLQVMQLDGANWLSAFTGFEEEMKGGGAVMSTFMADIGQLLKTALQEESVQGLILNPWNRTLKLDKQLIRIVLGTQM